MSIHITRDTLRPRLRDFDDRAVQAIQAVIRVWCTRAVSQMRSQAPWTDRTTAARNGLAALPEDHSDGASVHLIHSVPYGIWLEVRWSGRYAIIGPVMNDIAPKVLEMAGKAAIRAGGGR